ncbi:hypothetical protein EC973_007819 [Apophysomyces ossiformis]|uniref:PIN domain-containing protein n=1 Tax=Apophysomyces ossiformis TaxID=679940 RepID=A0A8H7BTS5_9FUNG|nr:hypothetical protein EC973_007819 [Apophysomyces ossiformis]
MSRYSARKTDRTASSRRFNDDYSRNTSQHETQSRQLFDPFSDHPITFNANQGSSRRSYMAQHREGLLRNISNAPSEKPSTGTRRLWQPTDDQPKPALVATKTPACEESKPVPTVRDQHKKKIKAAFADLQAIEAKIAEVTSDAKSLAFFCDTTTQTDDLPANMRYREGGQYLARSKVSRVSPAGLTETDLLLASEVWHKKIDLHIQLAEKYLDLIRLDYAFAEKKSLENLCWKRAVYSLVEQFRNALRTRTSKSVTEDDDDDDAADECMELPVLTETGMTFMKISEDSDDEEKEKKVIPTTEIAMLKRHFGEFLDKADEFYRQLAMMLRDLDEQESDNAAQFMDDVERHLQEWRRTKRLKWYKCIPNRGDIARYRWLYVAGTGDGSEKDNPEQRSAIRRAHAEAWQWYTLGIWLMPATGKLYFHLSLLMHDLSGDREANVTDEMHKLYYSMRSLIVRRNGFLNAREGMIVLFENNRRWIKKYLEAIQQNQRKTSKTRRKEPKRQEKETEQTVKDADAIVGLFIRLHGMMFTKIELDQFAHVKRRFFDALFPVTRPSSVPEDTQAEETSPDRLTGSQLFWFEAAILCLSSLYSYDYSSSKLFKLTCYNNKRIFFSADRTEQDRNSLAENSNGQSKEDVINYGLLLDELKENILFAYDMDLMCQIAVELFKRFCHPDIPAATTPALRELYDIPTSFRENLGFLFKPRERSDLTNESPSGVDNEPWMIYIELVLQWMTLSGICIRHSEDCEVNSLWEALVGNINTNSTSAAEATSMISPAFWSLLMEFLNKLLHSLPDDLKYGIIDYHLMEEDICDSEIAYARLISKVLGHRPELPEERHLRGVGWIDDATGKILKLIPQVTVERPEALSISDISIRRKAKILDYGFILARQMAPLIYYDPVQEGFVVTKNVQEAGGQPCPSESYVAQEVSNLEDHEGDTLTPSLIEMDDDVLLSKDTDTVDDEDENDDMLTQLKKRREQLQLMLTSAAKDHTRDYHKMPNRMREREARLNYLRDRVVPGKTVLVLDTNCFIGHLDHVKRLIASAKWLIVVPLVVITELDGLCGNSSQLGTVAKGALELIEQTLSLKQRTNALRIQTSHNNFMYDISIRSEQFIFGETDKNLDDLVLSACLWWIKPSDRQTVAPVCLVTGDRNLSVKARARDVEVVPVSGIMRLTQ